MQIPRCPAHLLPLTRLARRVDLVARAMQACLICFLISRLSLPLSSSKLPKKSSLPAYAPKRQTRNQPIA